jgi:hypothetical protein
MAKQVIGKLSKTIAKSGTKNFTEKTLGKLCKCGKTQKSDKRF